MRKTTLLAAAALLSCPGLTLAQNTPEENNPNADAPFVRNIRADRPGHTITAQVLQPGRFQLETGFQRQFGGPGLAQSLSAATLRIGFFNSMELRVSQPYFHNGPTINTETGTLEASGWAPAVVGAKFMLSPNYDTRTQVAILAESALPNSGSPGLRQRGWAPSGRLLVSQQLGKRFGLEGNFGFSQPGLQVADLEQGQFLGSLALNGPLSARTGFFVEAYGYGRQALSTGTTTGLYFRPGARRAPRCHGRAGAGRRGRRHRHRGRRPHVQNRAVREFLSTTKARQLLLAGLRVCHADILRIKQIRSILPAVKLFRKSEPKRAAGFLAGCPLVSRTISCLRRADSRPKSRQPAAYAAEFDFLNSFSK